MILFIETRHTTFHLILASPHNRIYYIPAP